MGMIHRELGVIRDEMAVIYRSVEEHKLRTGTRASALGELEARFISREQRLCQGFSAEIESLRRTVRYLRRRLAGVEGCENLPLFALSDTSLDRLQSNLSTASGAGQYDGSGMVMDLIMELRDEMQERESQLRVEIRAQHEEMIHCCGFA